MGKERRHNQTGAFSSYGVTFAYNGSGQLIWIADTEFGFKMWMSCRRPLEQCRSRAIRQILDLAGSDIIAWYLEAKVVWHKRGLGLKIGSRYRKEFRVRGILPGIDCGFCSIIYEIA